MKILYSQQIFEKFSNTKFHKNPSMWADLSDADRQKDGKTDMKKLRVDFRILQMPI